ncbi:hypothetical protein ASC77_23715 [Nocardioides sp. Root1257]|uniref:sugar ABC transporter ATP-binding protein n=1 Tax=unclassified Nocardioides TaxID=2615069 RepID=UPI0006FE42D1|nr:MULTISPECIES: sugar ABC transporter ATP-binding protein [unclassified Nocardioides]KQW42669.1 hypothetical protein ASC77_23715 [Nocardioides sp. Root1257]KRC39927.1 hypothetical protein ASE24_23510 [Nocardioides sp. Root224]
MTTDNAVRTADESEQSVALSVQGVYKTYPGVRALKGVDMEVRHGEVHALVGGNGSGKSTLIKVLCGVVDGDEGTVQIGGETLDVSQIKHDVVRQLGLRVVHQDLAVFPELSVIENMMLGSEYPSRFGRVQWREARRRAVQQMERFDINVDPNTLLTHLPVATRTQIAIARALQDVEGEKAVVILDEPTAALPAHEVKILLEAIRRLAERGHAVVFVSHRLDEVMAVTDRVTVFRDGAVTAEHRTSLLTEAELIESIVGRAVDTSRRATTRPTGAEPVVTIQGLEAGPIRGVDLMVYPGEIVGVAGLLGSGRTELLRAMWGDLPHRSGTMTLRGRPVSFRRNSQAIAAGVVMIPEDRVSGGSFADLTLDDNMNVSVLASYWSGWFRRRAMKKRADELRSSFRVKAPNGSVAMSALSGGNQQKAILARWLRREPILLLLDEPTQGVDVGSRADIYAAVRAVTDAGGAAIMVTSDLEELAQVVDRAVVLQEGRIVATVAGEDANAQHLNELIYTA